VCIKVTARLSSQESRPPESSSILMFSAWQESALTDGEWDAWSLAKLESKESGMLPVWRPADAMPVEYNEQEESNLSRCLSKCE
jgi:hypothetical protein